MTVHQLKPRNRIRENRKKHKPPVPQGWLADQLGVSRNALWSWETGRSQIPVDQLVALAEFFGISTDELLGRHVIPIERGAA